MSLGDGMLFKWRKPSWTNASLLGCYKGNSFLAMGFLYPHLSLHSASPACGDENKEVLHPKWENRVREVENRFMKKNKDSKGRRLDCLSWESIGQPQTLWLGCGGSGSSKTVYNVCLYFKCFQNILMRADFSNIKLCWRKQGLKETSLRT